MGWGCKNVHNVFTNGQQCSGSPVVNPGYVITKQYTTHTHTTYFKLRDMTEKN